MKVLRERGSVALSRYYLGTRWGCVVSVTPRPRFTPGNGPLDTHWIGGWVGLRAGLAQRLEEISFASAGYRTPVVKSVVRHNTDWPTPARLIWDVPHVTLSEQFSRTYVYSLLMHMSGNILGYTLLLWLSRSHVDYYNISIINTIRKLRLQILTHHISFTGVHCGTEFLY
jgi:hypothetical protein